MRLMLILMGVAVATPSVFADESRTQEIVCAWQAKNEKIRDLQFDYENTYEDLIFADKSVERGKVVWSRSNVVRIDWKSNRDQVSFLIADGKKTLYDFKQQSALEFGKSDDRAQDVNRVEAFLRDFVDTLYQSLAGSFVLGLSGESIEKQFEVTLVREDEGSAWLQLVPRNQKSGFAKSIFVRLNKTTFLVTQATFHLSNDNRIVRVYKNYKVNEDPPISREELLKDLPKGFRRN